MEIINPLSLTNSQKRKIKEEYGPRYNLIQRITNGFWGSPYAFMDSRQLQLGLYDTNVKVNLERGTSSLFLHIHQHPDKYWIAIIHEDEVKEVQWLSEKEKILCRIEIIQNPTLDLIIPSVNKKSFLHYLKSWQNKEKKIRISITC